MCQASDRRLVPGRRPREVIGRAARASLGAYARPREVVRRGARGLDAAPRRRAGLEGAARRPGRLRAGLRNLGSKYACS